MLPVRSLVYFLYTLQVGNLTETAQRFGVSVPTVSSSISRLEDIVGHRLFLRTPRGLLATEVALAAAPDVEEMLQGLLALDRLDRATSLDLEACHGLTLSLRLISRFVAVIEAGSIGGAAHALRITQPQISRQIMELETHWGETLFVRHRTGVTATPAAQALYARCLPICDLALDLIRRGNRRFAETLNTTRLGSVPPFHPESNLARFLARLCLDWRAEHLKAGLSIVTETTDQLIAGLLADELHAVIVEIEEVPDGCDSRVILRSELALLAGGEVTGSTAEEVLSQRVLVLQSRASGLRRIVEDWLHQRGVEPMALQEVDAMPVIGRLVAEPGFCSLIPVGAYPSDGQRVQMLPLTEAPVFSQRLVWRKDREDARPLRRVLAMINLGAA
jgi:DNA-binding transcriptional LysR family regulator